MGSWSVEGSWWGRVGLTSRRVNIGYDVYHERDFLWVIGAFVGGTGRAGRAGGVGGAGGASRVASRNRCSAARRVAGSRRGWCISTCFRYDMLGRFDRWWDSWAERRVARTGGGMSGWRERNMRGADKNRGIWPASRKVPSARRGGHHTRCSPPNSDPPPTIQNESVIPRSVASAVVV